MKSLLPALLLALLSLRLSAQSTWTNTAAADWGNAANWSPNGIPDATDAVVTVTNSAALYTTNTAENGAGPFPYVFGVLNCNYGGSTSIGGTPGGASASAQLLAAVSGGTPVINVAAGGYYFFYSVLSGSQGFNKTGPGNLTFRYNSNAQLFTGNVTVSAGTLELQQDSSLGNPANSVTLDNGATLSARASINNQNVTLAPSRNLILNAPGGAAQLGTYNSAFTNVVQGVISESAAGSGLTIIGGGLVVLDGVNTYTGPTTILSGLLAIGGAGQLGGGSYAAAITNNGTLNFNSSANQTLSGVISGSGSFKQSGSGTLTLAGANTYLGATTVSAGTLALGTAGSINNSASITISNATLDVSGLAGSFTYANPVTLNSAALNLGATTAPALANLSLSNSTLLLAVSPGTPNLNLAGTLSTGGGSNLISVTSLPALPVYPTNLTLITYNTAGANLLGANNQLNALGVVLPASGNVVGYLTNIVGSPALIQLVLNSGTPPPPPPGTNSAGPLTIGVGHNNVNLSWPENYLGWQLWSQTNSLGAGLGSNWYPWPNSVSTTNLTIPVNPANPAVFYRLSYGNFLGYYLTNMMSYWDGHYELDNANVPASNTITNISNSTYTWAIFLESNGFGFVADNEMSGNSDVGTYSTSNNKSRAELYVPLHSYTNGLANNAAAHIDYIIPPQTDYGTNNNPYWFMQIYGPNGKPMCFVSLHPAYGGQPGIPYLGVYTNMQANGAASGEIEYPFNLVNPPGTAIGDMRSASGFRLSLSWDFATNATTSVKAQITPVSSPGSVYQASCPLAMQSPANGFTNGTTLYLKFGSYNGGGTHHHAKVFVSYFDVWSTSPIPMVPVRGVGNYYLPALQRQLSAGNYNNLGVQ